VVVVEVLFISSYSEKQTTTKYTKIKPEKGYKTIYVMTGKRLTLLEYITTEGNYIRYSWSLHIDFRTYSCWNNIKIMQMLTACLKIWTNSTFPTPGEKSNHPIYISGRFSLIIYKFTTAIFILFVCFYSTLYLKILSGFLARISAAQVFTQSLERLICFYQMPSVAQPTWFH